jgi:riboflavin kinase/FMN adenylyltransferase
MEKKGETVLFEVSGIVAEGKKEATELGYPTANIACERDVPSGIYAGSVVWNGIAYPAAIYKEDGENVIEAHLLDFSGNLYGEALVFRVARKVRDVKKFSSEKDLIAGIAQDIATIKKLCLRE